MPATAGRVKMPAGNRMQTSASLNTHSIWQNAIGYDPYAAEQSSSDAAAKAETMANAQENMKALLALAREKKVGLEEEKGGWRGSGTLRGGWAAGKDLGEVPKSALPGASSGGAGRAGAGDDMPSSTSSFDSDDEGDEGGGPAASAAAALGGGGRAEGKKRARDEEDGGGEKKKKRKHSDKHEKKHKRHKEKKHKKEKKSHKHKRKHSRS